MYVYVQCMCRLFRSVQLWFPSWCKIFLACFSCLVDAIQKVEKIKQRRQNRFVKNRSVCAFLHSLLWWCNDDVMPINIQAEGRSKAAERGREEGSGTGYPSTAGPRRLAVFAIEYDNVYMLYSDCVKRHCFVVTLRCLRGVLTAEWCVFFCSVFLHSSLYLYHSHCYSLPLSSTCTCTVMHVCMYMYCALLITCAVEPFVNYV